ncbi:hypothetical protein BCV72DRAFT_224447 [Rhizopus microsporus var. microsporus]|uniref:Homeobox domain-containing protein n=1 Tax=Rhizopus microsporus var. microsporus TaxID=86635 RepID=A0A1X0RA60_RHIZD|nr:hypothetical protein BCV72DRAFT_224447 [Rhizopus microsporus var. microsporus]
MGYSNQQKLKIKSHEANNRPKRKRITPSQLEVLTSIFERIKTPNYQLREMTARELNMTNREVQVWFQNRRAKLNRKKAQEKEYFFHWSSNYSKEHYQATPTTSGNNSSTSSTSNSSNSSQSSVTSSIASTPTTLYSQIPPQMRPIDILALAAEYVQNCDEEKRLSEERRKSWRPWDS